MPHKNVLNPADAVLVVVDIQEAFRTSIEEFDRLVRRTGTAVKGFQALDLPVIATEQYPKGLGPTAEELRLLFPDESSFIEKSTFSACGSETFIERLKSLGRKQVVLCGIETHICVSQTAHDLIDAGYQVHVLTDCVDSRSSADKSTGLRKMELAGAVPTSTEAALFELLVDSKHPKFKEIQALIK